MKLFLARHSESTENAKDVFSGQSKTGLTKLGKKQAQKAGKFFANKKIEAIFYSDLKRTSTTAKIIAAHIKPKPKMIAKKALREIKIGVWQGKKREELKGKQALLEKKWRKNHFKFNPPKGENYFELEKRAKPAIKEILNSGFENILIVSHYGPTRIILRQIFGLSQKQTMAIKVENNEIFEINLLEKKLKKIFIK